MKIGILLASASFLLGFIASILLTNFYANFLNLEFPLSKSGEIISPYDHVKESQIDVYGDRVVINLEDVSLAEYANTNSMDPLLDEYSNGLEVKPESEDDLHIGDVVAYQTSIGLVIHRIVGIDYDEKGKYFVLKGDNNQEKDPMKVRFNEIKYLLVGVIY